MLEGIVRESKGKQEVKTLRRNGYLIANIYGKGYENINAAFKANDYIRTVRNKNGLAFPVKVAGQELDVVVKEYQSHPITGALLHVDLQIAPKGYVTDYMIPIEGTGTAIGIKNKGMLHYAKKRLRIRGPIEAMPTALEIDVTKLDVGDALMVRDLTAPKGTTFMDSDRVAVIGIIKAK